LLKRSNRNYSNKGKWQLPEGKMEEQEIPEETLIREIKEETNIAAFQP
jgi:8-oxo-dGTP pyrophosphatase MutT (NUDIX family)